jgi:RNA polymerase sigma-70 factor (ECF subfamily)
MISDLELAARVVSSDDQVAFQLLVERHQAAIRGFLRRLLAGDYGTADDLAQDSFMIAYRKLSTLKSGSSFKSWLHTIAYRQFLQFRRKHARQQIVAEPPEQSVDQREAVDAEIMLPELMRQVGDEERACLTLAYAGGMSHAEITRITGLPLGTVKSRIQRGKVKLQKWLEQHDHSIQKNRKMAGAAPAKEAQRA